MLDQEQFINALAVASADWSDHVFDNTADDTRILPDDTVRSRGVHIPPGEISPDYLAQAFRVLVNDMTKRATPATCYLTSKELWGDATHHFSLRDARTKMGFDVFSTSKGTIYLATTWNQSVDKPYNT